MEQITIWDILEKPQSDFPCDTCKHDVQGCCDYDEPLGRHCVLGDAYEPKEWKCLLHTDYIEWTSEVTMQLARTVNENHIMDNPDVICEGTVNGTPAYIGFKQWESGPNGIYVEYEAIQWKEKTT